MQHNKTIATGPVTLEEVLAAHAAGKLTIGLRRFGMTPRELATNYTPGVALMCEAILREPSLYRTHTINGKTVAIITNGTAVLGLGDIGTKASMPVMEGKALLMRAFANINAFAINIKSRDVDGFVRTVEDISDSWAAINLEDIAAPECFEIEERLQASLKIPVMHDDQHGTAIVVNAGLRNALKIVNKKIGDCKIVINGIGAAGTAITRLLIDHGARNVIGVDRFGAISKDMLDLSTAHHRYSQMTNPDMEKGTLSEILRDADVFIGVSRANLLTRQMVLQMAQNPIVFAMANPTPEIMPTEIKDFALVATGRSDFPNQINNLLAFPGVFRGLLRCHATQVLRPMYSAASFAISSFIQPTDLKNGNFIPSPFDLKVPLTVSAAVQISKAIVEDRRLTPGSEGFIRATEQAILNYRQQGGLPYELAMEQVRAVLGMKNQEA